MIVRSRAPLRLSFGGGGTELSPYVDRFGGQVLNATISLYAYTTLAPSPDGRLHLRAEDLDETAHLAPAARIENAGRLALHAGVYNRFVRDYNGGEPLAISVTTYCDAPMGSGLGASSTIVVSMIAAYAKFLGLTFNEYDVARLAFEIERMDIGLQGGRQDQYAAAFGGFNFMEFGTKEQVTVTPLRIRDWIRSELEASLVLYYTGTSRESAGIISEQIQHVSSNDLEMIASFDALKAHAEILKEFLLKGCLLDFARVLDESWREKRRTAASVSNGTIDEIYEVARRCGVVGGKISGAGGGGFFMLICDPAKKQSVISTLKKFGGILINSSFVDKGAEAWSIPDRAYVVGQDRTAYPSLLFSNSVKP